MEAISREVKQWCRSVVISIGKLDRPGSAQQAVLSADFVLGNPSIGKVWSKMLKTSIPECIINCCRYVLLSSSWLPDYNKAPTMPHRQSQCDEQQIILHGLDGYRYSPDPESPHSSGNGSMTAHVLYREWCLFQLCCQGIGAWILC